MSDNELPASEAPQASSRNRLLIGGIAGVLVLGCLCVAAVAVAIFVFDVGGLKCRLLGGCDLIGEVMPAGSQMYMQIDFLQLTSEDATAIINTFIDAADDPDIRSIEDAIEEMDESLDEEINMTFTDDIEPWLGQFAGIALFDFNMNEFGEPDTDRWVAAIETRDTGLADQFIEDLIDNLEREQDIRFDDRDYEGVTVYEGEDEFGETFAIARSKSMVFISDDPDNIKDAIDTQSSGEALADDPGFKAAMGALPSDRAMTIYIGEDVFIEGYDYIQNDYLFSQGDTSEVVEAYQSMAMSLSVREGAIQMDTAIHYDPEQLSEEQLEVTITPNSGDLAAFLPEETFGVIYGNRLDLVWEGYRESIADAVGSSEFNDMMDIIEDEVGFNPDSDLFPILSGEWATAVYTTNRGYLAEVEEVPIGVLVLTETSDAALIADIVDDTASLLGDDPFIELDEVSRGDTTYYEVTDPDLGDTMAVFGTSGVYLLMGTDSQEVEDALTRPTSLADNQRYTETLRAISGSMSPVAYMDVQGLLDVLMDADPYAEDYVDFVDPVQTVAVANRVIGQDTVHIAMIVLVDTR
jgi:hypothetical protein